MAAGEVETKEKEIVVAGKVEDKKENKKEEKKKDEPLQTNGLAIGGLVCSLVFFIPFTGIVGLILSIVALSQQKSGLYTEDSKTMAIVGVIVSALRIALVALSFIFVFIIIGGIAAAFA